MKEETNIDVRVLSLLLDEKADPEDKIYRRTRLYLCEPLSGVPKPGYDPEFDQEGESAGLYGIMEVKWFDLRSEASWDPSLIHDPLIYYPLKRLQQKLGYLA
jgi:hypothetical protein